MKKELPDLGGSLRAGSWDSIHVVAVDLERQQDGKVRYRVTSTVFLKMISSSP